MGARGKAGQWSHLYSHSRWRRVREFFLRRHPLCVMCEAEGRVELASVVDHIKPHKGDMALFWDRNNWQPLCASHHSGEKQRIDRGIEPLKRIGLDGFPVDQ